MSKITAYLKQGENKVYLKDSYISMGDQSKMIIRNITIYWHFNSVTRDNREVILTYSNGVRTLVQFGAGYWTFYQIVKRLEEEDETLTKSEFNNTCLIHHATHSISLGSFGLLLGFPKDTVIPAGTYKDSGRVNINLWLEYNGWTKKSGPPL